VGSVHEPVTVIITRLVRDGCEAAFENAVKAFIPKSLAFPGHLGVHMLRPAPGARDYGAVLKFHAQQDWAAFQHSPGYLSFLAEIEPYLERPQGVETLCGLESWFTPLGADVLQVPPRWKIAVVTWIGVCLSVFVVNTFFSLFNEAWPMFVNLLASNAVIVAGLTWIVMPALTWFFQRWLSPAGVRTGTDLATRTK
jgi:antibiotic biosynthesis monooxygenase (ABM) superfamily enzyme